MRTLYRASLVRTLTYPQTAEWVLIDGRHIQRVGSGDPPEADRTVDLPGATIVPGFVDTHVHLTPTGLALDNADVEATASKEELLQIARARGGAGPEPVALQGFDETRWARPEHPTLAELDEAVGGVPLVIVRADGHLSLANSAAIDAAAVEVEDGVQRDAVGVPTGRLTQGANDRMQRWLAATLTDHQIQELQLKAAGRAAAKGITAVHEMQMPHSAGLRDLQVFVGHRANLPVDALPIVATMDLALVIDQGFGSVGGDLPADGSIGARTAAIFAPYVGGGDDTGRAYYTDDELAGFFHAGFAAGLQVGMHAIGDRGIDQILGAWERVYRSLDSRERRHFRARRHRIEHFEMPTTAHIERAAMLGLAVSVQPVFDRYWGRPGGLYETALGPERAARMNPIRTMLDRGVEVGAGSDAPITPLDPLLAVRALQEHHESRERLSRFEAIRLHTIGSARLGHQEDKKGALGRGMHADFVAYDADPFEAEPLEDLAPMLTVSLGREVFAA